MARPGYFYIDPEGVIREKFFEAKYRERLKGNTVLSKLFPELGEEVSDKVEAPHLQLTVGQSDRVAVPGNLVTLTAEVRLPPDVHVYAPGTKGYKPITLAIDPLPELELKQASYPAAKILYLPAIKERVPVLEGTFRIRQELKVNSATGFSGALGPDGKTVKLKGTLDYQACDNTICFLPACRSSGSFRFCRSIASPPPKISATSKTGAFATHSTDKNEKGGRGTPASLFLSSKTGRTLSEVRSATTLLFISWNDMSTVILSLAAKPHTPFTSWAYFESAPQETDYSTI